MMRRTLALLSLGVLTLAACDPGTTSEGSAPTRRPTPRSTGGAPSGSPLLKIALVGTMAGPQAWMGEDAYEGADLGVHHVNRNLASGERRYELEVLDDRGDADVALGHLENLAERDDVVGIVYAGPPRAALAAEAALAGAQIPLIVCFGDLYGARELRSGGHVFQASPPLAWQARDLARYLVRDRRYRRIGILAETSSHDGKVAAREAARALRDYGIERPVVVGYDGDPTAALGRLKARRVEAIVVEGRPAGFEELFSSLEGMRARYRGTRSARIGSAPPAVRRRRLRSGWWKPQLAGFDLMITDRAGPPAPGTVAAAPYSRGVHYLPVPDFQAFRDAFVDWWGPPPLGFERRAYEATMAIGWAAERGGDGDLARALERLRDQRFGGVPVTLGPDDHLLIEESSIGLWTVPSSRDDFRERERLPKALRWVPLARGFSIDGETTDILDKDWKWLFRNPPPRGGPAPKFGKMKFGIRTGRSDPLR